MNSLLRLLLTAWLDGYVHYFGGSSAPAATTIPIMPPTSLFPSLTNTMRGNGSNAIQTSTDTMSKVANGVDVSKIYASIVDASKRGTAEGTSNIMSSMGASGMAASSDAMRSTADFQLQTQASLLEQLEKMQFQNEGLKLAGASGLMDTYASAGMTFAPTQAVVGTQGGESPFSQAASAGTGAAMAIAMLMMACWVAAELYGGWNSLEVYTLRSYGYSRTSWYGKRCWWLYVKFGQRVANHIKSHKLSRAIVKLVFDRILLRAFNWRISCPKQLL